MNNFTKDNLCKFVCKRPRVMGSIIKNFGYQVYLHQYLSDLIKNSKIKSTKRYDRGARSFYTKPDYVFNDKAKVKGGEVLSKKMAALIKKRIRARAK